MDFQDSRDILKTSSTPADPLPCLIMPVWRSQALTVGNAMGYPQYFGFHAWHEAAPDFLDPNGA